MGAVKRVMGAVLPEMDPVIALVVFVIVSFAIALPISWLSWRLFEQRLAGALRSAFKNPGVLGRAARV
jgi:peptidoglycan/LPS O-acetylase OafA/YrhL